MTVTITLAWVEGRNLLHLTDEFLSLVEEPRRSSDPALARLTPVAYPDDDAAAAEFHRSTADELFDRRRADAVAMRDDLAPFDVDDDTRDPLAPQSVEVHSGHLDAWLRTLAAIRLVVATRLGIDHADHHEADDPRFHVYDWLGYRLEDLIQRADDADDAATA